MSVVTAGAERIVLSFGDVTIAKLAGGRLTGRSPDVFDSKWLPDACAENRLDVLAAHGSTGSGAAFDSELLRRVDQQLVRRIIANVRLSHHGGTIVILPREEAERAACTGELITLKYRFADEEPRRRYRSLQLLLLAALGAEAKRNGQAASWETYVTSTSPECVAVDDALLELAHTIADLADVDGAVVMNKRMEVIGFGGRSSATCPLCRECDMRSTRKGSRTRKRRRIEWAQDTVHSTDCARRSASSCPRMAAYVWSQTRTGA